MLHDLSAQDTINALRTKEFAAAACERSLLVNVNSKESLLMSIDNEESLPMKCDSNNNACL